MYSETNGSKNGKIHVFFDIKIGEEKAGRVIIELYKDVVPKTVENFRGLCTGEYGTSKKGTRLHFKGTSFHRIVPQCMIQGGDISGDGSCGDSIYGGFFEDENFLLKHECEGTVGMSNKGPNTNISQFYITTIPFCSHLDGSNVVFGKVIKGLNIIKEISDVPREDEKPLVNCRIEDCGELKQGEKLSVNEHDETADTYPPWPDDYDIPDNCDMENIIATIKDSGNYFYRKKNFIESDRKYKKVLRYIEWINKKKIHHNCNVVKCIKLQTLLNLAAVRLNKQNYADVIKICNQVLELEPSNGKAFYRRGQARLKLKDFDKAVQDLCKATKIFPDEITVFKEFTNAKKMKLHYLQKERLICSKMFK